ncbi:MAG: zinc ribbon domain-containing protein [Polyangia bacterium]
MKCSECGKDVSDKASACPNCGAPVATAAQAEQVSRPAPVPAPAGRKTSKWAYVGLALIVGSVFYIYRAATSDHAAPLSAGLAGALRQPKKIVSDRFSLKEGQAQMFGFNLNMDARVEVSVEASPKNVDVMLMTANDLARFRQAQGRLFGGQYTYRQALSRQATMKMHQTATLPLGEWAIVVQRPKEALIFGQETTVSVDVTVY